MPSSAALGRLRCRDADFFVNLGDWPYADKAPPALTLDDYRERHFEARSLTTTRELLQRLPVFAVYDDHDVICNWDARDRMLMPERVAAAVQAWTEFFPLRGRTRYRSWRWGRNAELFMLDCRLYRSANDAPDDAAKTMLGARQKAWLMGALRASPATFKIVLSTVPFNFCNPADDWQAFSTERDELFDFIANEGLTGVVLFSADRHYFAAHQHPHGLREYHMGPLAAGLGAHPPQRPEVIASAWTENFGEVEITGGSSPKLTFTCHDGTVSPVFREVLSPTYAK